MSASLLSALLAFLFIGEGLSASIPQPEHPWSSKNVTFRVHGIGSVTGIETNTASRRKSMYAFYGLPYGEDTSGKNRFKHSIMKKYHNEDYDLTVADSSQKCMQPSGGTEDCLKLYIYTTKKPRQRGFGELPVMVWIYGGAFTSGDFKMYSGDLLLAQEDMVIVVPHYRLGVLGFMNLNTHEAPGNPALSDQVLALEWVQRYIRYFGGNPNHVVLAGESAGAASVSHLMLYDGAKDLFHGVISESGSPLDPWTLDPTPVDSALRYGKEYFGCEASGDNGLDEFVACMREQPAQALADNWSGMQNTVRFEGQTGFSGITPSIQKPGLTDKIIISEDPYNKMVEKRFNSVPVLYGSNLNEGSFVMYVMLWGYLQPRDVTYNKNFWQNKAWEMFLKIAHVQDPTGSLKDSLEDKYFHKLDFTNFTESVHGLIDVMGALFFKGGALRTAQLVEKAGADAYLYSFEYDVLGNVVEFIENLLRIDLPELKVPIGVFHALEVPYIFPIVPLVGEMKTLSSKMTRMWANFITQLNPTPLDQKDSLSKAGIPIWNPYTQSKQHYLCIDEKLEEKTDITTTWTAVTENYLKTK